MLKRLGIDQIFAKFLRDSTSVIAIDLTNTNLPIKLDALPLRYKIAKIKRVLKRRVKAKTKSYRSISLLSLILNVMEKSV